MPDFVAQQSEVQQIIEAPLQLILDPATRQLTNLKVHTDLIFNDVPHFNVYGKIVWGATAMMLGDFLALISVDI